MNDCAFVQYLRNRFQSLAIFVFLLLFFKTDYNANGPILHFQGGARQKYEKHYEKMMQDTEKRVRHSFRIQVKEQGEDYGGFMMKKELSSPNMHFTV